MDSLYTNLGGDVLQHAATTVEVASDIAHVCIGSEDLELHDGFKQHGHSLLAGSLETNPCTDLERELVGVDRMERAVDNADLHAVEGIAGENTVEHCLLETLLDGRNILLGNVATLDLVDKLQTLEAFVGRTDFEQDVSELALATSLLLVNLVMLDSLGDDPG